jgi:hypothetical protein
MDADMAVLQVMAQAIFGERQWERERPTFKVWRKKIQSDAGYLQK